MARASLLLPLPPNRKQNRVRRRATGPRDGCVRFAGMPARDMRAMFVLYLAVIASGIVGFTLVALLEG
jgi:hypothetical protein